MTPLYNHTSEETAFTVASYHYGSLRCQIKFWLEKDDKKGFRFCSRTQNPKTNRWNAVKKSTYSYLAGCIYLDEYGHCVWDGLGIYDDADKVLSFIRRFPDASFGKMSVWCLGKMAVCNRTIRGEANISINHKPCLPNEREIEEAKVELEVWHKCLELLKKD